MGSAHVGCRPSRHRRARSPVCGSKSVGMAMLLLARSAMTTGSTTVTNVSQLEHVLVHEAAVSDITLAASGQPYMISQTIRPARNLTLRAQDGADVALDGQGQTQLLAINAAVVIELVGLTLMNGNAHRGGAVAVLQGLLRVMRCNFTKNEQHHDDDNGQDQGGGAFYVAGGEVSISGSSFNANSAAKGGGGAFYVTGGEVSISGSSFNANSASWGNYADAGGAFYITGGEVSISWSSLNANYAEQQPFGVGGALFVYSGRFHLFSVTFTANRAAGGGADIYNGGADISSSISNCTFDDAGGSYAIMLNSDIRWICPLGSYMPSTGTFKGGFHGCLHYCPVGYYGNSPHLTAPSGANGCSSCYKGHVCPALGTVQPVACPPGTHMPATGAASNTSCLPCNPGTFGAEPGNNNATCESCPRGKFSSLAGQTACEACPIRGYCAVEGAVSTAQAWTVCPDGTIGNMSGLRSASECAECPPGHWCTQGSSYPCGQSFYTSDSASPWSRTNLSACRQCPTGATTLGKATPSIDGCVCMREYLTRPLAARGATNMCERCPANATCAQAGTTLQSLSVDANFWRPGNLALPSSIKRCPHHHTCANGTAPEPTYDRFSNATCAPGLGLAGAYCMLCQNQTDFFSEGSCHACEGWSTILSVLLPIACFVTVCLLLGYWRRTEGFQRALRLARQISLRSKAKIAISFYQIVAQLAAVYAITYYPPQYERIITTISLANHALLFSWLPSLHPTCFGLQSLLGRLLFATLAPVAVALVGLAVVKLRRAPLLSALPFLLYWSFLVFPSVSSLGFRALAECDCFEYVDERTPGNVTKTCFLRTDYEEQCTLDFAGRPFPKVSVVLAAWLAIAVYAVGVPLLYAILLGRRHAWSLGHALDFLTESYIPAAFFWELVDVGKKLTFTGFLALVQPGSLTQLYMAVVAALSVLVMQMYANPYRSNADNLLAIISEVALAFTLLGTLGLQTSQYTASPFAESNAIIAMLIIAALVVVIVATLMLFSDAASVRLRLLCSDTAIVEPARLKKGHYHCFLSHVWASAQDQQRVIRQRLLEMLPGVAVFLDVEDLKEGRGAESIDLSATVLVYCSEGYFASVNCMRELLRAVLLHKPIITLLEPEKRHGGLTLNQIKQQLLQADEPFVHEVTSVSHANKYAFWRLDREVAEWGFEMPSGQQLFDALCAIEPIEWNRIGAFQDVTMRLVAERLLPEAARAATYLRGELSRLDLVLQRPLPGRFHVYCSPNNAGAAALLHEMHEALGMQAVVSANPDELPSCGRMLLYLNGLTWTSGAMSDALAADVVKAMDARVPLLIAHEMPCAIGGDPARHSVEFDSFFACELGATPPALLGRGVYSPIAVAFKGGAWRRPGLVMLAQGLGGRVMGCGMGCCSSWVELGEEATKASRRCRGIATRMLRAVHRWSGRGALPDELQLHAPSMRA